jgi:hypothetical protein
VGFIIVFFIKLLKINIFSKCILNFPDDEIKEYPVLIALRNLFVNLNEKKKSFIFIILYVNL